MIERWLRLRAMLDEQLPTVVVGLLVLALLGGWISYTTHVAAGATTEDRTETLWESTGEFSHSAAVEADRSPFETGTQLTEGPTSKSRSPHSSTGRSGQHTLGHEAISSGVYRSSC